MRWDLCKVRNQPESALHSSIGDIHQHLLPVVLGLSMTIIGMMGIGMMIIGVMGIGMMVRVLSTKRQYKEHTKERLH